MSPLKLKIGQIVKTKDGRVWNVVEVLTNSVGYQQAGSGQIYWNTNKYFQETFTWDEPFEPKEGERIVIVKSDLSGTLEDWYSPKESYPFNRVFPDFEKAHQYLLKVRAIV